MQSRVIPLRVSPVTFHGLMDVDKQLDVGREPHVVLAYLPSTGLQETLNAMAEVWPSSQRLGCEAALQVANGSIQTKGALHFLWFDEAAHNVTAQSILATAEEPLSATTLEPFWEALAAANAGLLLVDGQSFPYHQLLPELERHRAELPPLAGAVASQRGGDNRPGARVFLGTEILPSGCVALGFHGVSMELHTVRSFDPASPVYTVTRAAGNVLYEVDGEGAVDWYRRFFTVDGDLLALPEAAYAFPLLVQGSGPRRELYRSMAAFDEDAGCVRFHGDLRTGDLVRLAVRSSTHESSAVPVASAVADKRPQAVLAFHSLARHFALTEDEADDEVRAVHEALDRMAVAGPMGFGEIASGIDEGFALHNHLAVLAVLRETH